MRHRPAHRRRRPLRIVGPLVLVRAALQRHGQAKAGASHGARFPSASSGGAALSGDAIFPDDPATVLRRTEAVGSTSVSRAESPRFHPLTPAVFRLAYQVVTFCPVIFRLFAARRGAFAGASLSARRSSPRAAGLRRLAGFFFRRQRSWDSTLRSFAPAGQFRDVFRRGGPRVVLPVASTSMVLVEASVARTCE